MTPRLARPLPLVPPVFSTAEARAAGVSAGRLRASDLVSPFTGMRARAGIPLHLPQRAAALTSRLEPDGAVSHATAAALHGLPLPGRLLHDVIEVTVPAHRRAIRMRGVAGHEAQLSITDVIDLAGTPVTSLPRTWCDLAPRLTVAELVALGDAIVGGLRRVHDGSGVERFRRVAPAVDRLVLARAVAERPGCRGIRRLRMALELLDGRAESPKESELRLLIVGSGLPAPEPQVEVRNRLGEFIARVDLAYRHAQVAIEYEGDHHRSDRVQWQKDIVRTRALEAAGWTVVRCTQHDLTHPNALVDCLRRLA